MKQSNMDLYLLIGQSNMAGRAPIPEDALGNVDRCFLLNEQAEWSPACNPFNRYSTVRKDIKMQKLGPGYAFAKTMAAKNTDASIGLVVNALGGSKIESWKKGGRLYTEAVARMTVAQQSGTLKGILWHQGESNHTDENYLPKLIQLIADLRADLNGPTLPFVVGQINGIDLINNQLAQLPSTVRYTACVSSEGLVGQDKWHFNAPSQLELGKRYADAMLSVQSQPKNLQPIPPVAKGEVDELIERVQFNSTNQYVVVSGGFKKRAQLWTDRAYAVRSAPPELIGGTLIQTPVADRSNGNGDLVTFTVQKNCTVVVGMNESDKYPAWISVWEKTDWVIEAGIRMVCYRKTFDAGQTVVLGGGRGLQAMYTVVIKEQ